MATSNLDGTGADITYTPVGGTFTVHDLAVKLLIAPREGFKSRRMARVFSAWNADGTIRETFTIGTPPDEIEARIRMDDEPASLRSMLSEGLENDVTLTYRPDGSTEYPAKLVSVNGSEEHVTLDPDTKRYAFGEWMTTIVLRRVDGNDFEGLL